MDVVSEAEFMLGVSAMPVSWSLAVCFAVSMPTWVMADHLIVA